jgi:CheY-like chemotaxis protein
MAISLAGSNVLMKCFLIDDDLDDQEIFAMAVNEFNDAISCYFADDGVKAIKKLINDDFLPDCIFIDINMPRMNGIECLEQIKRISRLRSVPVCMFSTSADPSLVTKSKELGAIDFIVKPASVSVLSDLLGDFINSNVSVQ